MPAATAALTLSWCSSQTALANDRAAVGVLEGDQTAVTEEL
jgi:hypothetical protein